MKSLQKTISYVVIPLMLPSAILAIAASGAEAQTAQYGVSPVYGVQTAPTRHGPSGATARRYDDRIVITRPGERTQVCREYADRSVCN